jgi:toxin ParE1/3/4
LSFSVRVRRAAEFDIAEAQAWYDTQQPGLGIRFYSEVMLVLDRLGETPFIYTTVHRDVRRAIVRHFSFLVWYRVMGQTVKVLAVTHGKQQPSKSLPHFR